MYALLVVKRVYSPTLVGLIDEKKASKKWVVQPAVRVDGRIETPTQALSTRNNSE